MIENSDQPGVVGNVGGYLGSSSINIDAFSLSRHQRGGKAMALVRIDGDISVQQIQDLKKLPHILDVRKVSF